MHYTQDRVREGALDPSNTISLPTLLHILLPLLRLLNRQQMALALGRWLNMNKTKLRTISDYKSAWGLAQLKINSIIQGSPAPTELRDWVKSLIRERPSTTLKLTQEWPSIHSFTVYIPQSKQCVSN